MQTKEEEARSGVPEAHESGTSELPAYSSTSTSHIPSANSPFDFPTEEAPPTFESISSSSSAPGHFQRPIAIPQTTPDKTGPFLNAYAQPLLQYGITPETWRAFIATISAFLAAKVSEQAVAHAADIGRHVTDVPKRFGEGTVDHAKHVGHKIRDSAKSGNYAGAAVGVVGGAIGLPVGTAFRAVGAAVSLPFAAIRGVTSKPQTPRERATAYAEAANKKWLVQRGLRAQLVDTAELARTAGIPVTRLLDLARASGDSSAAVQLGSLKEYLSELEVFTGSKLELGANTLWLTIVPEVGTAAAADRKGGKS